MYHEKQDEVSKGARWRRASDLCFNLFPKKRLVPSKTGSALIVLYRCGLVGGRVCILGDKSEIDARKEDRGSRKKKRGAILSGSNEGTIT